MNMTTQTKSKNIDMTKGNPLKVIILFTLPLLLGNIFQQLYNICDSAIVGQFVGDNAMAAVSSSGSLINLLIGLVQGIAVGAGIVVAQYFGAKDVDKMSKTIHTTVLFSFVLGIVLSFVGYFIAPVLLKAMGTDEEILPNSIDYFHVYFIGVIFTVLYNAGSSILRAVGDSKRPLYYLVIAAIINIGLDYLFIGVFNLGVIGAGVATIISQAVSSILTFTQLFSTKQNYRLEFKKLRFSKDELIKIIQYGIPTGLQNSIISFSNTFILSNVNSFGKLATTSFGAYSKIDGFATLPGGSFSMALSTYVGQNIGAKDYKRAKKGAIEGLIASMVTTEIIGILIILCGRYIVSMFTSTEQVIQATLVQIRIIAPFYFLLAYSHGISGVLRGAGFSKTPMIVMILFWVVVRICGIPIALNYINNDVTTIFWFYPFTWSLSTVVLTAIAFICKWDKPRNKNNKENNIHENEEEINNIEQEVESVSEQ